VVTTKLGSSDKRPGTSASSALVTSCKVYVGELGMGLFLLAAGLAGLLAGHHWGMATYMLIQGETQQVRGIGGGGAAAPRPNFQSARAAWLQRRRSSTLDAISPIPHLRPPRRLPPPAGCVFLAFGFNMVDCGGVLGGRLDVGLFPQRTAAAAAVAASPHARAGRVGRAATIPVIQLRSHEHLPLTHATLTASCGAASASAPAGLGRVDTSGAVAVLDMVQGGVARSESPTHSAGSGARTPDSFVGSEGGAGSVGSAGAPLAMLPVVKLAEPPAARWPSPTSSLVNIYAPAAAANTGARKGWRCGALLVMPPNPRHCALRPLGWRRRRPWSVRLTHLLL